MTPVVEAEPEVLEREVREPRFQVVVVNDDVTPMDFVVRILREEFDCTEAAAVRIMWEAHTSGRSLVGTYGRGEALRRVARARSRALAAFYPLTFDLEEVPSP